MARSFPDTGHHSINGGTSIHPRIMSQRPIDNHHREGATFESKLWDSLMILLGTRRIPTTAYHHIANGMVERFHRQLKTSIKCHDTVHWTEVLPLVLPGIRTTLKTDINCTAAELVYGSSLRIPGEFVTSSQTIVEDRSSYVARLKEHMSHIRPTATRISQRHAYIDKNLHASTHVYVRHDAVRKPLQAPYDGPYEVVSRGDKTIKIKKNGRTDSLNRSCQNCVHGGPPTADSGSITQPQGRERVTEQSARPHAVANAGPSNVPIVRQSSGNSTAPDVQLQPHQRTTRSGRQDKKLASYRSLQ